MQEWGRHTIDLAEAADHELLVNELPLRSERLHLCKKEIRHSGHTKESIIESEVRL